MTFLKAYGTSLSNGASMMITGFFSSRSSCTATRALGETTLLRPFGGVCIELLSWKTRTAQKHSQSAVLNIRKPWLDGQRLYCPSLHDFYDRLKIFASEHWWDYIVMKTRKRTPPKPPKSSSFFRLLYMRSSSSLEGRNQSSNTASLTVTECSRLFFAA